MSMILRDKVIGSVSRATRRLRLSLSLSLSLTRILYVRLDWLQAAFPLWGRTVNPLTGTRSYFYEFIGPKHTKCERNVISNCCMGRA